VGSTGSNEHSKITSKIGLEYRNERYRTISVVFPLQHERKISSWASYVPVMHYEKMAVTDMSICQRAVIVFLVKEGKWKAGFATLIQKPNDKAWTGITLYHPKRGSRKQYPRPSKNGNSLLG
jgi:hypothetical protein